MKKCITLLAFILIIKDMCAATAIQANDFIPNITEVADKSTLDTFIFILTLIVAIITILFAIFGVFEFTKVEKIKKKLDSFNNKMDEIKKIMEIHNQTMHQLNEFLYKAIYKIAENTESKDLLEEVTLNYHIASLYCSNFDSDNPDSNSNKEADFDYIQQKGNRGIIRYLEFIADHDTNNNNRKRARKIIGHIEEREKRLTEGETRQVNQSTKTDKGRKKNNNWICSTINAICNLFR